MASTSYVRNTICILIVALSLLVLPAPALAAPQTDTLIKEHAFKFYLDPSLVSDMDFAIMVLPKYVADMNTILQKNTNRHLLFDPSIDIILTNTQPHSNMAFPPLPVEGFEIWAHAVRTNFPISNSGYAGVDQSGAGVLAGLKWTRLYDPDNLTTTELADYWTQIHLMLHEMAHVFGAGYGEYYSLFSIPDNTAVSPLLDINIYDQNDSFWSIKPDFMTDPLLRNPIKFNSLGQFANRESLLYYVEFSKLTAAIISNNFRNGAPTVDLSNIKIKVISDTGLPIESVIVKIWSVVGTSPYASKLMVDAATDANGELAFAWGGGSNPHNSNDLLRLIKVYKDGYEASASYVSIYDTDIVKLVDGSDFMNVTIQLSQVGIAPRSTFEDVPVDNFAWSSIERVYTAGITGGCSLAPVLYCPDQFVTRGQMAIFLERAMNGPGFSAPELPITFNDTTNHWARYWIELLADDGVTAGCGNGSYCPDLPVTRAQMAIFLLRAKYGAAYTPPPTSGLLFQDVSSQHWASAWIEQLNNENITSGCGNGNFCPDSFVTRAQMAVFLGRIFELP